MRAPRLSAEFYNIFSSEEIDRYLKDISSRKDERDRRFSVNYLNTLIDHWSDPSKEEIKKIVEGFLYPNSFHRNNNEDLLDNVSEDIDSNDSREFLDNTNDEVISYYGKNDDTYLTSTFTNLNLQDEGKEVTYLSDNSITSLKNEDLPSIDLTNPKRKRPKRKAKKHKKSQEEHNPNEYDLEQETLVKSLYDIDFSISEDVLKLKGSFISAIASCFNANANPNIKSFQHFLSIPISIRKQVVESISASDLTVLEPKKLVSLTLALVPEHLIKDSHRLPVVQEESFIKHAMVVDKYLINQINLLICKDIINTKNALEWLGHLQLNNSGRDKFQIFTSWLFQHKKINLDNCKIWLKQSRENNNGDRESFKIQILRHAFILNYIKPSNAHLWAEDLEFDESKFIFEFINYIYESTRVTQYKFLILSDYYDAFINRFRVKESVVADIFIFAIRGKNVPSEHRKWKHEPDKYEVLFIIMMFELQKYVNKELEENIRKIIIDFDGNKYPKYYIVSSILNKNCTSKNFVAEMDKILDEIKLAQEINDYLKSFSYNLTEVINFRSKISDIFLHYSAGPNVTQNIESFIEKDQSFINVFRSFNLALPSYDISDNIVFLKELLDNDAYSNDLVFKEYAKFIFKINHMSDFESICKSPDLDNEDELKNLFIYNFIQTGILLNEITIDNFESFFDVAITQLKSGYEVSDFYDRIIFALINKAGISVSELQEWYHLLINDFSQVKLSIDSSGLMLRETNLFNHIDSFEAFYDTIIYHILEENNLAIYDDAKPALRLLMLNQNFKLSDAKTSIDKILKTKANDSFFFGFEEHDCIDDLDKFLTNKFDNDLSRFVDSLSQISKNDFKLLIERNLQNGFAENKTKKLSAKKKSKTVSTKFDFFGFWQRSLFLIQTQEYFGMNNCISKSELNQLFLKQAFIKEEISLVEQNFENLYLKIDFSKREIFILISQYFFNDSDISFKRFSNYQDKIIANLGLKFETDALTNAFYQEQQIAFFKTVKDYDDVSFAQRVSLFENIKDFNDNFSVQNNLLKVLLTIDDKDLPKTLGQEDVKRLCEFFEKFLDDNPDIKLTEIKTSDFHVLKTISAPRDSTCLIS
ncbi:MAG: hypothetical protein ISQ32_01110 [Rickettsiales bacterium]|nr:hypothetical protein [Rickettsiales bacterium]